MYKTLTDRSLSYEGFQLLPIQNNCSVSTREQSEKENYRNYDVGLAVVPFARSSKTVRRSSEDQHQKEFAYDENPRDPESLFQRSTSVIPQKFPWERIGHASREPGDGIRVQHLETKPFPFGVFGSKVVARRDSPGNHELPTSTHVSREDLPHPSKIMRRKKYSKTRQKRFGMDVEAHVAQLRRKHAEFNWLPKTVNTDESCLLDPDQFEIIQSEGTLQKVPNSCSPLRNQLWSGATPGFYSNSPNKLWKKEHYGSSLFYASKVGLNQDQSIPNTSGLFEPEGEDDFDEDFQLIGYATSDATSYPCDDEH